MVQEMSVDRYFKQKQLSYTLHFYTTPPYGHLVIMVNFVVQTKQIQYLRRICIAKSVIFLIVEFSLFIEVLLV